MIFLWVLIEENGHYELQQYIVAASGSFTFVLETALIKRVFFE
jgi:hypothetical protein